MPGVVTMVFRLPIAFPETTAKHLMSGISPEPHASHITMKSGSISLRRALLPEMIAI
jgi:hypothetical protein